MIIRNGFLFAIAAGIGEIFIMIGKLFVCFATTAICYYIIAYTEYYAEGVYYAMAPTMVRSYLSLLFIGLHDG